MKQSSVPFVLICLLTIVSCTAFAAPLGLNRPYRALVVVERWSDPASILVDHEKDVFQPVAALLKAWSVPFDIFRLDQQHLDASYLFDREDRNRYGVVIWLADAAFYQDQDLGSLVKAMDRGTSLIVAKSRFLDPALEQLVGLKFKEAYTATDPLHSTQPHFITRELARQKMDPRDTAWDFATRSWVEVRDAQVLIAQTAHAVLTVKTRAQGGSAIWLGAPNISELRDSPYWRGLFFRSLIWSLGCLVVPNIDYSHAVEFEMDDWGTSDKGYLSYWRYLEPGEQTLREHLIAPLQKHRAVMSANVITGYVDRKTNRIVSPWTQDFTDAYGLHQDFASTRRGLMAAVAAGVLEIQSHGWTHMLPDLDSPPGPWWSADLAGEASADGWYKEFADDLRGNEVPTIVQLFHLQRSLEYLQKDFGRRPLEFRPGGGGWSKSYANQTALIAARLGFGLFHGEPSFYYYLDRNLVVDMSGISPHATVSFDRPIAAEQWPPHPDGPFMAVFHDRDISLQPEFVERLLSSLPAGYQTVSANQYIAYEHAQIDSSMVDGWQFDFRFDDSYCQYFDKHASSWRVWLADPLREQLQSAQPLAVIIDGRPRADAHAADLQHDSFVIDVPEGLGIHTWKASPVAK